MLETLGTIASVAGNVGSIASGLGAIGGLFGGKKKGPSPEEISAMNLAHQKDLIRNQIPLMVAGAQEAGLHPLTAVGVNPASFGGQSYQIGDTDSMADRLSSFGQNISRAAAAYQTTEERKMKEASDALALEKMQLENNLLRAQTTQIQRATTPAIGSDSAVIDGQTDSAVVDYGPVPLNAPSGFNGSKEGGATTDWTYSRTSSGGLAVVPSADVKQRIEDTIIPELQWTARNTHILGTPPYPDSKDFPLPEGYIWRWNNVRQEWRPFKRW